VFGAGNFMAALTFLPIGLAADRWGGKPLLVGTWFASALGGAAFIPLTDWRGAFIGSFLYWVGSAAFPLLSAHLAATTKRTRLGGELGIVYGAFFFGTILASPFAGAVGAAFGLRGGIAIAAVVFFISASLTLFIAHVPPAHKTGSQTLPRSFWMLLAVTPFAALVSVIPNPLFPVYVRDVAAIPLERVGVFIGLVALGSSLTSAVNGRVSDAFGPLPAIVGAGVFITLADAIITLAGRAEGMLALGSLLLGAQSAANPVLAAALARVLPPARAGVGYNGFQLAYAIGFGAGGSVSGVLYDADPLLPFLVQIALALPVTVTVAVIVSRVVRSREAVASAS
jgi:MFS family permease